MSSNPASPDELSPQQKRELLAKLLKEKAAQSSAAQPPEAAHSGSSPRSAPRAIQPVDRSQPYFPLSSAQQRLWLLDQFEPGNPVYNISLLLRLKGELNLDALQKSLQEIQNRHENLRVNFRTQDGQPVQFIVAGQSLPLAVIDLEAEPFDRRLARAETLAGEAAQQPFDLSSDDLARANLFRLSANDHLFQFVIHHIIFDGWSLNIFLLEFTSLYTSYSTNSQPNLPALPTQYIDYASWETRQFEEGNFQDQLDYWKNQLSGSLPILDLPIDQPRPAVQSFRAGNVSLDLSPQLSEQLVAFSRKEGVTLFVAMLSVFTILLARYTGQEDIIIGTPIARRSHQDVEKLIGVFLNNLALRTNLSGRLSYLDLLKRVRAASLEAFNNQEIPFERLLNALRIERDPSHTPVFQVFFNLLDLRKEIKLELPGLIVETPSLPEIGSIFDLTLYVQNWGNNIKLKLVYNADLFFQESMEELLQRYHSLLEQVLEHPARQIFSYSLPSSARQQQAAIIDSFARLQNQYCVFQPEDIQQSIPQRFEQQVNQFPQAVAVKTPQHEWTYQTLNQKANQAAHALLASTAAPSGAQAQERVALLFSHDAPMIAGLLGALKAGKTYIPLDPNYPLQRLETMLADSGASAILSHQEQLQLAQALAAGRQLPVINIDQLGGSLNSDNPCLPIAPDALAYILYTSGSTGEPKGVMQSHRNVLHFMRAYTNNLHIGAADRLTLLSSYSFDAAVMDIFGALLNGAALLPVDLKRNGIAQLIQVLQDNRITIYHSTPTVYRYFLNTITPADAFPDIRLVVLGGEAVNKHDVELFRTHFSADCVFINGLGPTESTVSLQYFIDQHAPLNRSAVPVGFPVAETEVVLLNPAGEETFLSGEIAIRSPYVALGYWNKPEITQAAFGDAHDATGKRIYRTGDMGCLLPDGALDFRGRKDFQVKIRGHRVEVGEVETVLAGFAGIKECAVTTGDDGMGGKRLLAYYVPAGQPPAASALRQYLLSRVPDYMIPAAYIALPALPLTPTGKIDRRALPDPGAAAPAAGEKEAARDETERKLVEIWQELLRLPQVGIKDNFFELGGHSLMAVHLFTRINQEFGINLPLATLFQEATIEHLANVIQNREAPHHWSSLIDIEVNPGKQPFFCVHGITGDILWFRDLAHCLAPFYSFYGLQARGLDGVQEPLARIEAMAELYISEIRAIQPKGPYYLGGASLGGTIALEIAQQLTHQGEVVALLAVFDHSPANVTIERSSNWLKHHAGVVRRLLKNVPHWLNEYINLGPARMWRRAIRWLRLAHKLRGRAEVRNINRLEAADLIDFASELPDHRRNLVVHHFEAMKAYTPKPYPGAVTLFRATRRPLLKTNDPELVWQVLTPGRIKVIDVPGSHEGMFKEPHVHRLADYLKACLDHSTN